MTLPAQIQTIAYLGDSLTDSGEIFALTQDATGIGVPISPIYDQQLSNGPVYADLVPDLLGLSGGLNFAVGGAKATGNRTIREYVEAILGDEGLGGLDSLYLDLLRLFSSDARRAQDTVMDLFGQAARLVDAVAPEDRATVAVSVLIGANDLDVADLAVIDPAAAQAAIGAVAATVAAQSDALLDAGFGTVLLSTLPSGSFFPAVSAEGPLIDALADAAAALYNAGLRAYADSRADVTIIDLGLMADEVAADIGTFGFTNIEGSILPGSGSALIPTAEALTTPWDQFVFVDELHPATQMHEIWAAYTAEVLSATYSTGTPDGTTINLTSGDDFHLALAGDDTVVARGGDDVVLAGLGDDLVRGGAGVDVIAGGSGNDTLHGGRDGDLLVGNDGDDILSGGRGNDILVDGDGSDVCYGGHGNDIFIFTEAELFDGISDDTDTFHGGRGRDTLVLQLTAPTLLASAWDRLLGGDGTSVLSDLGITTTGIESFLFTGYGGAADALSVGGAQAQLLEDAELWNFI